MFARALRTLVLAASLAALPAAAQQVVRLAYVDPLSGAFANIGEHGLKHFQFVAEELNRKHAAGGFKLEIVGFDNKVSPQESLNQLKKVIDQGIRYIIQGNGSSVALALHDAVEKHNERNPGKEILYLNYAAVDPDSPTQVHVSGISGSTPTRHEDGGAHDLPREGPEDQEGLPAQPELLVRPGGGEGGQELTSRGSVPTSRSSATTCIRSGR